MKRWRNKAGGWLLILVFFQAQGVIGMPAQSTATGVDTMAGTVSLHMDASGPSPVSRTMMPACPHIRHFAGYCGHCTHCGVAVGAELTVSSPPGPVIYPHPSALSSFSHITSPSGHPPRPSA